MFIFKKTKLRHFQTRNCTKTYDIMEIATFIINYCAETNRAINNLYLQKLLYFVYAFFITETTEKKPLFKSRMEAWAFGPAFPEVYYEFQHYLEAKIEYQNTYRTMTSVCPIEYNKNNIEQRDREIIMFIIDKYRHHSLGEIVFSTQSQDPWSEAFGFGGSSTPKIITDKMIKNYFICHQQA